MNYTPEILDLIKQYQEAIQKGDKQKVQQILRQQQLQYNIGSVKEEH